MPFCAPVSRIMVRKGWSVEDDLSKALWKRILMGPRPPSVRWPLQQKFRQEVPKRSQSATSKPPAQVQRQSTLKANPAQTKIGRIEAALKVLGQDQSDARTCLEDALRKAKTESAESRGSANRPPDASVAEANAKVVRLEASLAALGPNDVKERRVLEEALSKVRVRATVAPVG